MYHHTAHNSRAWQALNSAVSNFSSEPYMRNSYVKRDNTCATSSDRPACQKGSVSEKLEGISWL